MQELCALSTWLPEPDRALIRSIFDEGKRVSDVARLMKAEPSKLRRRVKSVAKRVTDPRFRQTASLLARLAPTRRRVAMACLLGGMSMRDASHTLRLSLHQVRKHCQAIETLLEIQR